MGAWGTEPWDNDDAADWFGEVFDGIDIDSKITQALAYDYDNYDQVRAAAYLLDVLGVSYIWPGDLDKLDGHLERALQILTAMIDRESEDEEMDFLELWDDDPDVIKSVEQQIRRLQMRFSSKQNSS